MSVQKLFIKLSNPFKSHHFEKFPIKSAFICQQEKVITTYINTHIHFALLLLQTVSCKCNALCASELQRADPSFAIRIHNFYHQTKAQVNVFMSVYQLQASTLTNYALSVVGQPAIGRCFHSNCVNKHSSNNRLWKKKKSLIHIQRNIIYERAVNSSYKHSWSGNQALQVFLHQPPSAEPESCGQLQQLTPARRAGTSVSCASIVFSYCHSLFISH